MRGNREGGRDGEVEEEELLAELLAVHGADGRQGGGDGAEFQLKSSPANRQVQPKSMKPNQNVNVLPVWFHMFYRFTADRSSCSDLCLLK